MAESQYRLFKTRRFTPLFLTQFLGAFNDNLFKNALVILITYQAAEKAGYNPQILVTAAAGIFIFPFFLFSATAGQLADRYDKASLIRIIKLVEIFLMVGASIGFIWGNIWFLLTILFLMGTQSSFFGPLKYAILPHHLEDSELIGGNALIEAGTFISILTGTILGALLIRADGGVTWVSSFIISVSLAGWAASLKIPSTTPAVPNLTIEPNIFKQTWVMMKESHQKQDIFLSIMGISWFWLIGATFLSQFPNYAKFIIGGNEQVVTLFLTLFSVGIGVGSLFCNRLLKGQVSATFAPIGALGMTIFMVDLFFASQAEFIKPATGFIGASEFLSTFPAWRILFDLFAISACGGIYIVPLYAILQARSEVTHRARTIAANNIMNALFMVVAAIATVIMLAQGFSVPQVFLVAATMNAFVAVYICKLLPHALIQSLARSVLFFLYRVEVKGLHHYEEAGDRRVIIANHLSFLDVLLIAAWIPDKLTFAINTHIAKLWWIKPFLSLAETLSLDPTNPLATRTLIDRVKKGHRLVIFPEGRLTVTGSLMKVYEGPGMIADKSDANLVPVRLEGAQFTPFTRLRGKVRVRWFPRITVTFLPPVKFNLPDEIKGRKRRRLAGEHLYTLMTDMLFQSGPYRQTLYQALLDAKTMQGSGHTVVEDQDFQPLTYFKLLVRSSVLGKVFANNSEPGERVGLLLPNSLGLLISFFGLQAYGRVPAMLNFSTGARNVAIACKTACIKTVYTSRRFIQMGKLETMVEAIEKEGVTLCYLEDLRPTISLWQKLSGVFNAIFAETFYQNRVKGRNPDDPAVVLFTSGSEGTPKGVVLSHANILANRLQVGAILDFGPTDVMLNVLPMFHSFGLTVGTLLPILSGIRTFLYPTPLHYRIIPEVGYNINATILLGTDTFLSGYAKFANPYDFYNLRYVFAGAEKLKEETRQTWQTKFGIRILEGYGATETAPVLALNTPMHHLPGSVGRLVPGMQHRIEPVTGIDEGGKLWVSGPNVMSGYLRAEKPGILEPPEDKWYDTGDIVTLDDTGFITIKGRAKRFAKVGGEMVSLTAVETFIADLWPGAHHAVVSLPDPKKGEQLVLVTDYQEASRDAIQRYAKDQGIGEINLPKAIKVVDTVPVLGTGKTDYVGIKAMVENRNL
ncbi:MAG: acyl-[ACP]--phospholipid O-acyltransferase [Candidatus Nitronauta litoralis]|uniref:Acyl-[ACP]--phospholipid O-acyltransferase n=1 Tax=Candidatus Nitronauta litoralis TaxID=2705533 RepID=A0A7T0BVA5_9BACT|nr:MAG: acyl-[ACP]--phospholipid O-acyltransferase [Candidatus Nitronauta litoralis]